MLSRSAALTLARLPGGGPDAPGARAAGRVLREARIGWGAARHHAALDRLVAELSKPDEGGREDDDAGEEERREHATAPGAPAGRGEAGSRLRRAVRSSSPNARPEHRAISAALASATRTFVTEFARVADPLDGAALAGLQTLLEELELLSPAALSPAEAAARLADAVRGLSVESDRARPGRIHVTDVGSGGYSGRRHAFLVGLDEARHPGADLEDPVLLDDERRKINRALAPAELSLFRDRPRDAGTRARGLRGAIRRRADGELLELEAAQPRPAERAVPVPVLPRALPGGERDSRAPTTRSSPTRCPAAAGFAPGPHAALDETEWWLSALTPGTGRVRRRRRGSRRRAVPAPS